jgi:hypothetical protein
MRKFRNIINTLLPIPARALGKTRYPTGAKTQGEKVLLLFMLTIASRQLKTNRMKGSTTSTEVTNKISASRHHHPKVHQPKEIKSQHYTTPVPSTTYLERQSQRVSWRNPGVRCNIRNSTAPKVSKNLKVTKLQKHHPNCDNFIDQKNILNSLFLAACPSCWIQFTKT